MSSSRRKILLNKVVAVDIGCNCRRPKLSSIFNPKPKSKYPKYQNHFNLSNSSSTTTSSTSQTTSNSTISPYMDYYTTNATTTYTNMAYSSPPSDLNHQRPITVDKFGRQRRRRGSQKTNSSSRGGGSSSSSSSSTVAVEKDSDDPYLDFRQSMLQMIVENGIYSKDDLKEMLNSFLQLNSPCLHGVIIRAFTEIWNSVHFDSGRRSSSATPGSGGRGGRRRSSPANNYNYNYNYNYDSPKVYVWPKSYEI